MTHPDVQIKLLPGRKAPSLLHGDTEFQLTPAYVAGAEAFRARIPYTANPHKEASPKHQEWDAGHENEGAGLHKGLNLRAPATVERVMPVARPAFTAPQMDRLIRMVGRDHEEAVYRSRDTTPQQQAFQEGEAAALREMFDELQRASAEQQEPVEEVEFRLTAKVTDANSLHAVALDHCLHERCITEDEAEEMLKGPGGEVKIGMCLRMLLDPAGGIPGLEIQDSGTNLDEHERDDESAQFSRPRAG